MSSQIGEPRRDSPGVSRRPRLQAGSIAELQRSRLVKAAVAVASEHGYEGMSATAVIARAGVSRKTFYELFASREDCFLAVIEESLAEMAAVARPAYEQESSWSVRLRAALLALLEFLEGERDMGALALAYLVGYGPRSSELRARALGFLQRVVAEGNSQAKAGHESSPLTAELVVGGVLAAVHTRLQSSPQRLRRLVNSLMWMIVLPYLGPAAARRQLTRTTPKRAATPATPASDPLRGLEMRLTYRTGRALAAVAEEPGRSNVEIAARVEVTDQGQISKLLARLARLGLIENTGAGQAKGTANAWHLTPKGSEVESAIRRQFAVGGHPRIGR
ncbi:MAG TPA: TetR/AcrR family transcriptional regulator [Solirubrobacteraceae bacterium]|jgi:AcrR family transcriptional regulator/DNA-binding MarR family transcriptional regulator|nr:TetR/AcrR family transcriptional regulator [Solirubrobacteraceae bacterium]